MERLARRAALGLTGVEPPDECVCPITLALMLDPVVASDGHSYERASIEEVLRGSGLSPRTREVLDPYIIVPNRALRNRIEEHEAEQEELAQRGQDKILESLPASVVEKLAQRLRGQARILERLPASVVEERAAKLIAPEPLAAGGKSEGAGAVGKRAQHERVRKVLPGYSAEVMSGMCHLHGFPST